MNDPIARITDEPIDEAAIRAAVDAPECGAVVLFAGVVRDHDGGRGVTALDYRAHPDAELFLARCLQEERERTGLRFAAAHRIGALKIGDVALVVAAAAAHRPEAFEALERLVQRIKDTVPIWKRQHYGEGVSEWVGL
jgi:molybdopterin synthase catalytic subunit